MMLIIRYIVSGAALGVLLALVGCTEYINLKLDSTAPLLVVDAVISTEPDNSYVQLSLTADYFVNGKTPRVSGASVIVSDGSRITELKESPVSKGLYQFPMGFAGIEGLTYHLVIDRVDNQGKTSRHESVSTMPHKLDIDSVGYEWRSKEKEMRVLYYGRDNVETRDYYMFIVAKNDSLISDQYSEVRVLNDDLYNGSVFNGVTVFVVREKWSDNKPAIVFHAGDYVKLMVCGITRECYDYVRGLSEEVGFNNPVFGGPPANLKGNISNGALGFFNTISVVWAQKKVIKK